MYISLNHCVSKYGVFSGTYFPVFGLNTEIYSVNRAVNLCDTLINSFRTSVEFHVETSQSLLTTISNKCRKKAIVSYNVFVLLKLVLPP